MKGSPICTLGAFLLRAFLELFAGHGRAVDAVASGLGADVDHRVSDAGRLGAEDLIEANQAERESVDQRIAGVAGLEACFAAEVRYSEAVAVAGDAADHTLHDGVVFVDELGGVSGDSSAEIGPKRSESITASGRAFIVKMSRRMPPTPVAAPWNGSI